jgi:NO-binding membrane sensor protein with MHYT domain
MPLFDIDYRAYTVVISILEASLAATAALSIFFKYRSLWQDSFPKRCGCAVLLAAAVCGMHYIALAGTRWKFKEGADWRRIDDGKAQSVRLTIGLSEALGRLALATPAC